MRSVGRGYVHGHSPGRRRDQLHRGAHSPSLGGGTVLLLPGAAAVHDEGWHHAGGVQERLWPQPGDRAQDVACDRARPAGAAPGPLGHLLRGSLSPQVISVAAGEGGMGGWGGEMGWGWGAAVTQALETVL